MEKALDILKKYWGYDNFRPGQDKIISSVLSKKDTLALLPTGGGKSITYQVPALLNEGICIVVTPLIALMKDQVATLQRLKIRALAVYSGMTYHEINITLENAVFGGFKFLYVSPERLESEIFKARITSMNINLIAVDESHCISQWGYDFRPSYLNIKNLREYHPDVPVLALTATATPSVVDDIQEKLAFKQKNVVKTGFTRKNLVYAVREIEDKHGHMIKSIKKLQGSGIIYSRNRKKTKELAALLSENGISADFYHAGLRHETRDLKQSEWTTGKTRVICATNAFGMGIDKPDVRFVVHLDIPDSLEEYFQEAGRAGRDGNKAFAVLLFNKKDITNTKKRLSVNFAEISEIKRVYKAICNYYQIPIGSGKGSVFDFNIAEFCSVYKLNILIAYNCLKTLETEGYIEVTDDLNNPARVFFTINRDDLYKFQLANQKLDAIIKLLLRSYSGLFNNYVAIDENALAKKTGLKPKDIYQYLVILAKQKIINYIPQKKTPLIIFSEERLDDKDLFISPKNYLERKKKYEQRLNMMLNYVQTDSVCRNNILLDYFGEKPTSTCGQCDVCRSELEKDLTHHEFHKIKLILFSLLEKNEINPEDLDATSPFSKEKNTKTIRILLDNKTVTYTNTYKLKLIDQ